MSKIRTIFITGLHRSGTTILDMILGTHSSCIAVGEVDNVIKVGQNRQWIEDHYNRCTCGKCEFWPAVMEAIDQQKSDSLEVRYTIFLKIFSKYFPGKIPIDSSKHLESLHVLSNISDCKSIRIVRDVRGWSVSLSSRITPNNMLRWYWKNRNFQAAAPDTIRIGYEPLVLNPEDTVPALCHTLSLEFEPTMLEINNAKSHILVGNRMRTNQSLKIKYDGRWMEKTSIWPAILFPVMKYNSQQVYGQIDSY